jgi:hypothetical protein
MQDFIEFTDRERFVLSYYRDSRLSSWRRYAALQGAWLFVSAIFVVAALLQGDVAWGLVGYCLLF